MPKGEKQKYKLAYLKKILLEKSDDDHKLSVNDLIAELDKYGVTAERKSIYTDIANLQDEFGLDVIEEKIANKNYYYVGSREFELAEVKLLIDAIQSSKFITEKKTRDLIDKLKKFASEHQGRQLQRQVVVQGRSKADNKNIYNCVDTIHLAIANNQKIRFQYFKWNADKTKWILNNGGYFVGSPWALMWEDENYYLLAFDDYDKKCKHYRVDKMQEVITLDEPRDGREEFEKYDMATYSKSTFGMNGGDLKKVKIQFHKKMSNVIFDQFGTDIPVRPIDDKHCETSVDVYVSSHFYGWIFSLGWGVKVVGPEEVVEEMKKKGEEYLKYLE